MRKIARARGSSHAWVVRHLIAWVGFGLCCAACSTPTNEGPPPSPAPNPDRAAPVEERPAEAEASEAADPEPTPPAPAPVARAESLEMTFVGDVIFGRYRDDGFDAIPDEGADPFEEIAPLLKADVTVANLETPLSDELPEKSPIGSKYRFGASKAMASTLADAGVDVVSLANNHYYDLREPGQRDTPRIVEELGLMAIGESVDGDAVFRVETLERNGWKVGFLAVTTRRNTPQFDDKPKLPFLKLREMQDELVPVLKSARADHDVLVVYVHWGDEYAEAPDLYHRRAAHALIDGGADLVVGHHPHVLQGIERYGEGLIAYSMGNFLFENTNEIPRQTGVLRVRFSGEDPCLDQVVFHPAYIKRKPFKHPAPATGGMGKRVRNRAISQAKGLDTTLTPIEGSEDLRLPDLACGG
jgi:poly-gamma-glutamate synthesis protein (capsule biosynthesis protein)